MLKPLIDDLISLIDDSIIFWITFLFIASCTQRLCNNVSRSLTETEAKEYMDLTRCEPHLIIIQSGS